MFYEFFTKKELKNVKNVNFHVKNLQFQKKKLYF